MKKILFIDDSSYNSDKGNAAQIRTNFIAKGLQEHGCSIVRGSYKKDAYTSGQIYSTDFHYILGKQSSHRIISKLRSIFIDPFVLFFFIIKHDYDILVCDRVQWWLLPSFIFSQCIRKRKFVIVINEYLGVSQIKNDILHRFVAFLETRCLIPLFLKRATHIVVISAEHEKYYKRYNDKAVFIVVPMLLEYNNSEKENLDKPLSEDFKICYAGTLTESNGMDLLLESIRMIKTNKKFSLHLFGPSPPYYYSHLKKVIADNNMKNVFISPPKENSETIEFLKRCDLMVIPKIIDRRAVGYIPSKLGDFMYSGKPVLVTNVGEINKYILDGINGYLCTPDASSIAAKISYILDNQEESMNIGVKGKETAKFFDYKMQSEIIFKNILD